MTISFATCAHNEGKNIGRCLKSIKPLVNEIIVLVEDDSVDKTFDIAKTFTKNVFKVKHEPMFHINRQKAIDKTTGDWVLNLDADEELTPELVAEIRSVLEETNYSAFRMPRSSKIFNKWLRHTGWYPDYQIKLFKKGKGVLPQKSIHEDIQIDGEIGTLKNNLLHYHYDSISDYLSQFDSYTTNDAEHLSANGELVSWYDALRFPFDEFNKRFFFSEGYKDGMHGLVLSLLQAANRLVVFTKMWEKQKYFEVTSDDAFLNDVTKELSERYDSILHWAMVKSRSKINKLSLKIKKNLIKRL